MKIEKGSSVRLNGKGGDGGGSGGGGGGGGGSSSGLAVGIYEASGPSAPLCDSPRWRQRRTVPVKTTPAIIEEALKPKPRKYLLIIIPSYHSFMDSSVLVKVNN
uniref:Uncharacterized protein n=1 Tax=Vespula pensylvanica TaxID=30213 RepID=A0A834NAL5_VESPE|nr:hypothetical protein H0235_015281 [Vespula pensylvanica]